MNKFVWRVSDYALKYCRQDGALYVSGQLKVLAAVRNLAPIKTVSIRYSSDNWSSWKDSVGVWCGHCKEDDTDQFVIHSESTLPPGGLVSYAIYYVANGLTYWDNNNDANYSVRF